MPSIINTNLASLTAQRNLSASQGAQTDAMQRLSSGLRINSAKDDAAGLAISTRFSSQTQGLAVAIRNAGDGISLAQTAEGALGTMTESLQRVRELALQAANGTNSDSDREALNAEAQQMIAEITRTADETNFNGQKLLNGDFNTQFQIGANAGETIGVNIASVNVDKLGVSSKSGVSAVGTNEALGNGDLIINGVAVSSSSAADDDASTSEKASSAIAKVAAINKHSDETGVKAVIDDNVAAGSTQEAQAVTGGSVTVNGVKIDVDTTGDEATTRAAVAAAINAESDRTGVKAIDSGDKSTGVSLVAEDGRNIEIKFENGTDGQGNAAALNSSNTGLASSGTFAGGYTLVAEGDTKEISISGGNGTGNGDLSNSGLSKGDYKAGISAVSSADKTGDAGKLAAAASGTLDLSSLKGVDFSADGASTKISINIDGKDVELTVNGDLSSAATQAAGDINLSSVYGNDYSDSPGTFDVVIDGEAVTVGLNGDYRTEADSRNAGVSGIAESHVNQLSGTQKITVDGVDVEFVVSDLSSKTGDELAASLEADINSAISNAGPAGTSVKVESDGNGFLTITSGAKGGSVEDHADNDTFGANTTALDQLVIKANGGVVLDETTVVSSGDKLVLNVDGSDENIEVTFAAGEDGKALSHDDTLAAINLALGSAGTAKFEDGELSIISSSTGNKSSVAVDASSDLGTTQYSIKGAATDADLIAELNEGATSTPATSASLTLDLGDLKGTDFSAPGASKTINIQVDGEDYSVEVDKNLSGSGTRATGDLDLSSVYGKDFSGTNNGGEFTVSFTDADGNDQDYAVQLTGDYRQESIQPGISGITKGDLQDNTAGQNIVVDGINIDLSYDTAFDDLSDEELRAQIETDLNDSIATYNNNNGVIDDINNVSVKLADDGTFSIESSSLTGTIAEGTAIQVSTPTSPEPKTDNAQLSFEAASLLATAGNALADTDTVELEINGATFTFSEDATLSTTLVDLAAQLGGAVASGGAGDGITDGTTLSDYLASLGPDSGITIDGDNLVITAGTKSDGTVSTMDSSVFAVDPVGYVEADQAFGVAKLTDADLLAELQAVLSPDVLGVPSPVAELDELVSLGSNNDGKFTLLGSAKGSSASITITDGAGGDDKIATGISMDNYQAGTGGEATDQQILDALNLGANSDKFEFALDDATDDGKITLRSKTTGSDSSVAINSAGGGTAGIVEADANDKKDGENAVTTGGLGAAALSFITEIDSADTADGKFTLRGSTAGADSTISITAGSVSPVASNFLMGTSSEITDQQILDAIDTTALAGKASLNLDDGENDGKFTLTSSLIGKDSSVGVNTTSGPDYAELDGDDYTSVTVGQIASDPEDRNLDAGDLVINNVAVKAAQASDDVASYSDASSSSKTASGIAIAKAINKSTAETGVSATVNSTEYVGGNETTDGDVGATGAVWVNGIEISLTSQSGGGASRAHAADQINAVSGQTGVVATDNGNSLSLTAADGRNIVLAFDTDKGNGTTAATDFGLGGVESADITNKADADNTASTTYSNVSLTGAGEIEVSAGINGSDDLDNLGMTAGTFGGGESGTFIKDIDLSTVESATAALAAIDNALDSVNSQRAELGAIQNRFETTVKNLQVNAENLTAANSRIRDADFAAETAELSRAQVLQQAGTSILAQANALPQQVLSLLQ